MKSFRALFVVKTAERAGRLAISLLLVLLGWQATGAISGIVLAYVVGMAAGAVVIARSPLMHAGRGMINRQLLLQFGTWSLVHTTVAIMYTMMDAFLLSALRPVAEVGFFSIAFNWVTLVTYLVPLSSVALFPYFSEEGTAERRGALFILSMRYTLLIVVPLTLLLLVFAYPIIRIFYGAPYVAAAGVLGVLGVVALPVVLNSLLASYFIGSGKPRIPALITGGALVAAVALNLFLIPLFGAVGAAAATVVVRFAELLVVSGAGSLVLYAGLMVAFRAVSVREVKTAIRTLRTLRLGGGAPA